MTTTKEALEACPFCGSDAIVFCGFLLARQRVVECTKCRARATLYGSGTTEENEARAIKSWNTRVSAPIVAPVVDNLQRRLYEECVTANWDPERKNTFAEEIAHLHEELSEAFRAWRRYKDCEVREVNGKLEGVPIEFADALIGMFYNAEIYGFDLLAAVERKHQFNLGRNYVAEGRQLHTPAPAATVAPQQSERDKITPFCVVHQRLEDADKLECEIGNDCVACSLNERRELLAIIAPFAAEGNTEDSVTVLRRVAEFYQTHVGEGRVVVSYPALLHCSCGAACTPDKYEAHRAMDHDAPAALGDEAEQCSATCADFSMHLCGTAHRCVLDAGHPFDPFHGGGIHEFETHPTIVRPRKPAATTPPSIRAKAAAEEIANWLNWKGDVHPAAHQQNIVSITAIIERCLAGEK